jgi:hypothetical protein
MLGHAYTWGLFLSFLAIAVPRAGEFFVAYNVPLPRLTELVLGASGLVSGVLHPIVTLPLLLVILLGADWLMLSQLSRRGEEGWALAWSMLMFSLPILLIVFTVITLLIPFLSITTRISG